jgi:probable HAF family extracellular repeat protein
VVVNNWTRFLPRFSFLLLLLSTCDQPVLEPGYPHEPPTPFFDVTESSGYVAIDLGTPTGGWTEAWGINEAGQIVCLAEDDVGWRTFIWEDGVWTDVGTLGGNRTYPGNIGLSEAGHVVGSSETDDREERCGRSVPLP